MIEQVKLYMSLALLMLFSVWYVFSIDPEAREIALASETSPDYYMEGFLATSFDKTGLIKHRFGAQRMAHYPINQRAELTGVLIIADSEEEGQWEIRAGKGSTSYGSDIIDLSDDIQVQRTDIPHGATIETASLQIDTANQHATTAYPVRIHAENAEIKSIGVYIDFTQRDIQLTSRVRGQYQVPAP